MTNLARIYDNKAKTETNITTRKTYLLGVDELYVETGYNIREIDQDHVLEFRDAFIAGEHVPPLAVQVTEQGIKVIDGHHRYHGALLAKEAGYDIRLECKDFVGSEADRIAFMVTSSQGRPLEPLERAAAYQRLINQGWEPAEIAKKVKRSAADVEHHLQLLSSGDELIAMVKNREVAATTVVALVREHGVKAGTVAKTQLEKAKATGKKKLTKADAMPQFSAALARKLVELLAKHAQVEQLEEPGQLTVDFSSELEAFEAMDIIRSAKEHFGIAAGAEPEQSLKTETQLELDSLEQPEECELPLARKDILEQSGVEVWGCAAAAFGDKDDYTFSESKYAHTWAADSVESPSVVVIPPETVAKAVRLIKSKSESNELRAWLAEHCESTEAAEEMFRRFTSAAIDARQEAGLDMAQFLKLAEKTDRQCWSNVRMLRCEIRDLINGGGQQERSEQESQNDVWPAEVGLVFDQLTMISNLEPAQQRKIKFHINRMLLEKMPVQEVISAAGKLIGMESFS